MSQHHQPAGALVTASSYTDAATLSQRLLDVAERCNLVTPAPDCGFLPDGFSVSLSSVLISSNSRDREVYSTDGGLALHAVSLNRIANAAGVSFEVRRTDDKRDAHVCAYIATAHWKHFDNTWVSQEAPKELDLRDVSDYVRQLRAEAAANPDPTKRDAEPRIRMMRKHIVALCETMARSRAIRKMGLKSAYSAAELERPFVVARLMVTPSTARDPETRRVLVLASAHAAFSGRVALYGREAGGEAPPQMPSASHAPALPPAPPPPPRRDTGTMADFVPLEDDERNTVAASDGGAATRSAGALRRTSELPAGRGPIPAPPKSAPRAVNPAVAPSNAKPAPRTTRPADDGAHLSGFLMPRGSRSVKERGGVDVPIEEASARDLGYWSKKLPENIEQKLSRDPVADGALAEAMRKELARRPRGRAPRGAPSAQGDLRRWNPPAHGSDRAPARNDNADDDNFGPEWR